MTIEFPTASAAVNSYIRRFEKQNEDVKVESVNWCNVTATLHVVIRTTRQARSRGPLSLELHETLSGLVDRSWCVCVEVKDAKGETQATVEGRKVRRYPHEWPPVEPFPVLRQHDRMLETIAKALFRIEMRPEVERGYEVATMPDVVRMTRFNIARGPRGMEETVDVDRWYLVAKRLAEMWDDPKYGALREECLTKAARIVDEGKQVERWENPIIVGMDPATGPDEGGAVGIALTDGRKDGPMQVLLIGTKAPSKIAADVPMTCEEEAWLSAVDARHRRGGDFTKEELEGIDWETRVRLQDRGLTDGYWSLTDAGRRALYGSRAQSELHVDVSVHRARRALIDQSGHVFYDKDGTGFTGDGLQRLLARVPEGSGMFTVFSVADVLTHRLRNEITEETAMAAKGLIEKHALYGGGPEIILLEPIWPSPDHLQ